MTFLTGDRVSLEPLDPATDAHVAAFREAHNHPEMRATGNYETGLTAAEAREAIAARRAEPGTLVAIVAEGDVAGWAGAEVTDERARVVELSYYVLPAHQGKGYATDAVRTLVGFAVLTLNAESVVARVRADNEASRRVVEKAGFQREGTRRRAYYKEGEYHDVAIYGRLRASVLDDGGTDDEPTGGGG